MSSLLQLRPHFQTFNADDFAFWKPLLQPASEPPQKQPTSSTRLGTGAIISEDQWGIVVIEFLCKPASSICQGGPSACLLAFKFALYLIVMKPAANCSTYNEFRMRVKEILIYLIRVSPVGSCPTAKSPSAAGGERTCRASQPEPALGSRSTAAPYFRWDSD